MKSQATDAAPATRLAEAEKAMEARVLDRILADIENLDDRAACASEAKMDPPQVHTPRLVLVR